MAFVNKMDRAGADFLRVVEQLKERLKANAIPIQLNIGAEDEFAGVIDLVRQVSIVYDEASLGAQWTEEPIPESLSGKVKELRHSLIEAAVEHHEGLLEKYLEDETLLTEDEVREAIRHATVNNYITPVLCGASFRNKGVQQLLDAVVDILPSPTDVPAIHGHLPYHDEEIVTRDTSDEASFSALAFKIATDPFVGRLTYLRVYSGSVKAGSYVYNASRGKKERIARLLQMHANRREERDEIYAGDICAAIGLKDTRTGETLCDKDQPIILEAMKFLEPVISVAIEPKTKLDEDKLAKALAKLAEEDPTFKVYTDPETGQTIISGMGELHLEIIVDRLRREFKVDANVGRPQVSYRETIRVPAHKVDGKYIRQTGGRGQYGHVVIDLDPADAGSGMVFEDHVVGGSIPREYIGSVEQGVREAMDAGVLAGYPMVDLKVTLIDGSYHEVDSSEMAFKIAGSMALREAVRRASPVLLEPVMDVEVVTPEEYLGAVVGELSSRRGKVGGITQRGEARVVGASVPLAEMFGYSTALRSMSQGRAVYTMQFSHYDEVPKQKADEILNRGQATVAVGS